MCSSEVSSSIANYFSQTKLFSMIAKRPERSNVSENELFAGMTFPEVPRGPILVKPTSSDQPHYTQNIELTTMEKKNVHEELDISQFLEENETTSLIQKDKTDSLRFQTNFSTLYRIEVIWFAFKSF